MKIELDRDKCVGMGTCVGLAPQVFAMAADGKAELKILETTEEIHGAVAFAVDCCGTEAIRLVKE